MSEEWQTTAFRQNVVSKINEAIASASLMSSRNGTEMESHVFSKAKTKEEYLGFVAKLIIHVRDTKNKNAQQQQQQQQQQNPDASGGMQDPINALQNLASQGTRQQLQPQMMIGGQQMNMNPNMGPVQQGSNVLQSLIHQRPGQQQMPNMQNIRQQMQQMPGGMQQGNMQQSNMQQGNMQQGNMQQGNMQQGNMQQGNMQQGNMQQGNMQQGNMQQGNMPPGAGMVNHNMNIGMGTMGNQVQNPAGQIGNIPGQMNTMQMGNMQNQQINPMGNMVSMSINQQQQMGQNPMNVNMNNQMNPGQHLSRIIVGPGSGALNHQSMGGQMGPMNPNGMPQMAPNNMVQQQQMGPNVMSAQMPINQPNMGPNPMSGGPMNMNPMMGMQQQHLARKPQEMMMNNNQNMYQVRNVGPGPFFRKSPSPSTTSPANIAPPHQGQMVPSPALVASPQMPNMQQRNAMGLAPSPSSSINTPGQAVPSPLNPHEEQQYREKYRQLTKYIEPLKRMVARIGNDGKDSNEKLLKMNKLLEILCNPNRRIPLDTLLKCEIALEKMDFKTYCPPTTGLMGNLKEHPINNPLLEAVSANLQSPIGNHTLQRSFRPCLEALFGPDIKNLPSPAKQQKLSTSDSISSSSSGIEIPHVLQGEIARLDQKFKVSLDPSSQNGTKLIKLVCCLDSQHLPCVPPVSVVIPDDYPFSAPSCKLIEQEYNATPFLISVQGALVARISKLPKLFSLSHLLDTWEMSVRQACSPALNAHIYPTPTSVLLGV